MSNVGVTSGCQQVWEEFVRNSADGSPRELAESWSKKNFICSDENYFTYRLARLYLHAGMYELAEETIQSLKGLDGGSYKRKIALFEVDLEYFSELKRQKSHKFWRAMIIRYEELLNRDHESEVDRLIYQRLSTLYLLIDEYDKSVSIAEEGLSLGDEWYLERNLVIAYFNMRRYEEAVLHFNRAYQGNPNIFSQNDIMYAAARSYAATGKIELAKRVLAMLAKERPVEVDTAAFKESLYWIRHWENNK